MLLRDFFENEYRPRRLFGKSPNTVRLYRLSITAFEKTLERPAKLEDLTNSNVIRHMQSRIDGLHSGKSKGTANKDRCQLLAMWRCAVRIGLLAHWPEVPQFSEPERVPRAWMREELDRLFAAIDEEKGDLCGIPGNLWWRSLIGLALDTGERIGAMFPAKWSWLEGQWMDIPAETRKGGKRDRRYWISVGTSELLDKVRRLKADEILIFPWPYNPTYVWKRYEHILRRAKLPHGRQDKFHRLRKTHASVLHAAGVNAQDALDHQHRRTTKRYLDPRFERTTKPSDVLTEYLSNPPNSQPQPQKKTG